MTKATKYIAVIMIIAVVFILGPGKGQALRKETTDSYRIVYYAKAGDTLKNICLHYSVDDELVAAMNNMDPATRFTKGKVIYLPKEPEMSYVLKKGDTLWDVAQKYRISINVLIRYNHLLNPDKLKIGQVIKIPVDSSEETMPVRVAKQPQIQVASRSVGVLSLPLVGVITSPYGWRAMGFHHGTDIAAKIGTPIKAVKSGVVMFSGWRPIYGYSITIDHGNEVKSVYGHASKLLVKKGEKVVRGQSIAQVGNTGRTTGPHLHLEIHIGDKTVDPMIYLKKR